MLIISVSREVSSFGLSPSLGIGLGIAYVGLRCLKAAMKRFISTALCVANPVQKARKELSAYVATGLVSMKSILDGVPWKQVSQGGLPSALACSTAASDQPLARASLREAEQEAEVLKSPATINGMAPSRCLIGPRS